jgi:hypothetical protein
MLQREMEDVDRDFKVEKDKLFTISNDMNRQYKQMQDELLKDINELKKTVVEKDDVISNWLELCVRIEGAKHQRLGARLRVEAEEEGYGHHRLQAQDRGHVQRVCINAEGTIPTYYPLRKHWTKCRNVSNWHNGTTTPTHK